MEPNFTVEVDFPRDLANSSYVLNMAPTEFHSVVPTLAALGSPFYNISSQLSLNLPTQDLGFNPVQSPYEPFSFSSNLYNTVPFPVGMDTNPLERQESLPDTQVGAMAFKKLMDRGSEVLTLRYILAEPLPMDEKELIARNVPLNYHGFLDVLSREAAQLSPPHWPCHLIFEPKDDQALNHSHIHPLLGMELDILQGFLDDLFRKDVT